MQEILVIRSDRLGEFLLSLPAIKLIKENFPKVRVSLLAQWQNIELVKRIGFIDKFLELEDASFTGLRGAIRLAGMLRRQRIDCALLLNPKKEFHLAAYLARVPLRVGYDRKWGWCLNRKIKDLKYLEEKHEVEYNIDLVCRGILQCAPAYIPDVDLPVDQQDSLDFLKDKLDLSKRYILLHPFTSNPLKKVDGQFWRNLANKLKEKRFNLALIGSGQEKREADLLAKEIGTVGAHCHVPLLVGDLTLRNLATFLKYNCRTFIGLDSGPLHLASLLKVPVVGLFNISNPKRWGPYRTNSLVVQGKIVDDFTGQMDKIFEFIYKCRKYIRF